jgi:hypothetical protein
MGNQERDKSIERLLGQALRDDARATGPCLDAEILAAWSEDRLPVAARAAAESHAASCLRCQAVLAAMARTADAGAEAPAALRPGLVRGVRWLVPLAGAAAAAALVLAVWPAARLPEQDAYSISSPRQSKTAETASEAVKPSESAPASPSGAPTADQSSEPSTARSRENETFAVAGERRELQKEASDFRARRADTLLDETAAKPAQVAPPAELKKQDQVAAAPPPPQTPPQPLQAPRQQQQEQLSRDQQQQRVGAARPISESARLEGARAQAFQSALPVVLATPVSSIMWRIVDQREIQRTDDGGATWTSQTIVPDLQLAAGSCPTTTACWIVGGAGAVLRMADGRTWQRLVLGEAVDLVAVRAADSASAVVTARDGRTFVTTDGGRTWARQDGGR